MKPENREKAQARMQNDRFYRFLQAMSRWLDRYYLDAIAGLVPWGIGDIVMALVSLVFVVYALVVVRSPALAVALTVNTVRDVMLGLIPFHVGDVIDFFHRSIVKNMQLIEGFVEGDTHVVNTVNSRMAIGVAFIVMMIAAIIGLFWIIARLAATAFRLFTTCPPQNV